MGLRPLSGGDVENLRQFVQIAAFSPNRSFSPDDEELQRKLKEWLGGWTEELGVAWEEDRQLVGAAWARLTDRVVNDAAGSAQLHEVIIGVIPERRGEQLGTQLMEGLQRLAVERDIPGLWLRVSDENPVAIRVYEKVGFVICDERSTAGAKVMIWHSELAPRS